MKSPRLTLNVFVYGTLKPGEANYQHYCADQVRSQSLVYTWGNLYALPVGYPAMTTGKNKVQGVLLGFDNPTVLNRLDRLEGYQAQRVSSLNQYGRQSVPVYSLEDRLMGEAHAYFMTLAKVKHYRGTLVESGWWSSI